MTTGKDGVQASDIVRRLVAWGALDGEPKEQLDAIVEDAAGVVVPDVETFCNPSPMGTVEGKR